ncbi:NlpC/P60 family protein [Sphaerisporangium sp. B11E5]|uniref:C40 family peptidase n=1 Tax=Sphaerisporangium sp. B11E5 TaxID=3153563 RepID=UPI00325D587D
MIVEAGAGVKALIAGASIVSGIALIAGTIGGAQVAATSADPVELTRAVCSYTGRSLSTASTAMSTTTTVLDAQQWAHALIIVNTAIALHLPSRAAVIGIATALQESRLNNETVGDHGTAFGLFQQRPVSGWGTKAQATDPHYAARKFYSALVKVKNWRTKPLTVAAQAVQNSAYPDAYARHEALATAVVAALWPSDGRTSTPPTLQARPLTKDLGVTPADLSVVRSHIEIAASLGVDRRTVVSDIAQTLQGMGHDDNDSNRKTFQEHAEKLVSTVADRLCRELQASLYEPVQFKPLEANISGGSLRGSLAARAALTMLGVPYSWGGGGTAGPSFGVGRGAKTKGFDCSALTQYAWARAGVSIPRVTYDQWTHGSRVYSIIQPGDLIFYETNPRMPGPDHVGLAISNSKMVHAPRTGTVVRTASIQRPGYVGAIRPTR